MAAVAVRVSSSRYLAAMLELFEPAPFTCSCKSGEGFATHARNARNALALCKSKSRRCAFLWPSGKLILSGTVRILEASRQERGASSFTLRGRFSHDGVCARDKESIYIYIYIYIKLYTHARILETEFIV